MQELKSKVSENNKWKLIQEVQKEYQKCHKYSVVGRNFNIDDRYDYNNGLAEGSVNKIKVIKRIMYGRCCFDLLKQQVLLQY